MTSRDHLRAAARSWERAGFYEDAAERFLRAEAWRDAGRSFSQAQRHRDAALAYSRANEPLFEARQHLMSSWPERARSLYERLRSAPFLSPREEVEVLLGLGEVEAAQGIALSSIDATFARLAATRGRPDLAAPLWSRKSGSSWERLTPWNRSLRWKLPPPVVEPAKIWPSVEFSEVSLVPIGEIPVGDFSRGDRGISWAPNSKLVAVALTTRDVGLLTIDPGEIGFQRLVFSASTQCVAFSRNGRTLLTGHRDGSVHATDVSDPKPGPTIVDSDGSIWSLATSPIGHSLAISSAKSLCAQLKICGVHGKFEELEVLSFTMAPLFQFESDCAPIASWSPDGRRLAWASNPEAAGTQVTMYEDGKLVFDNHGHEAEILSLSFSPCSQFLITASRDRTLVVRESRAGLPLAPAKNFAEAVYGISIHAKAALFAVIEGDRLHLLRFTPFSGQWLHQITTVVLPSKGRCLSFSPSGGFLSVVTSSHLHLFRVELKP